MGRYMEMIQAFQKMPEYEGAMISNTGIKKMFFKKKTDKNCYYIQLNEQALDPPALFQLKEEMCYEWVDVEETEKEVQQLVCEIRLIQRKANAIYQQVAPQVISKKNTFLFLYTDLIEEKENFKNLNAHPHTLWIWMEVWREKEKVADVRFEVENKQQSMEECPIWRVKHEKIILEMVIESNQEEITLLKKDIGNEKKRVENELNKPYRLLHLFS